ncbi:MAG: hypothetical protein IPJ65_15530 [Archangiaceae bacterium]|nr:hypothetical protein [Archangiaceae bacterium]
MKSLTQVGERLLSLFVPALKAGACVPENGSCCAYGSCHARARGMRFTCNGSCVYVSLPGCAHC